MPPGPSPGHINMETDCGARDRHCQHDTDRGFAFAKRPGRRNPRVAEGGTEGSWELAPMGDGRRCSEDRGGGQTLPPPCPAPDTGSLVCKMGKTSPNTQLGGSRQLLPAKRKGKTNADGWGWRQRHPRAGRTDGRTDRCACRRSDP